MNTVYGVWISVGAYEGADELIGLYSSEELAKQNRLEFLKNNEHSESYITVIALDGKCEWVNDALGELV